MFFKLVSGELLKGAESGNTLITGQSSTDADLFDCVAYMIIRVLVLKVMDTIIIVFTILLNEAIPYGWIRGRIWSIKNVRKLGSHHVEVLLYGLGPGVAR